MTGLPWALVAALALPTMALPQAAAQALPAVRGPLAVDNLYPAVQPFLAVPAESPGNLGKGGLELCLETSYANGFHWDPMLTDPQLDVLIDGEVLKLTLSAAWVLAEGLTLEGRLPLLGQFGGFLDPLIQGFHDLFWLPNGDRELYPDNRYAFRVVNAGRVMVDLDQPFWALGDLVLSGKWTLRAARERGFGAALQAAVSFPTGCAARFASSGRLDASIGALASWRLGAFAAYGGLRYLYFGEPEWSEVLGFRPHNLGFFLCLEWARRADLAWLLQADAVSLPYLHPHPWFSGLSSAVSFGARFRVGSRLLLELHLSEELFGFAAMDIAAGCAATVGL